ncbi:MAG: DUF1559 domain-containing protein [Gemmataceae bacterium]
MFLKDRNFLHNPPHTGLQQVVSLFTFPADSRTLVSRQLNRTFVVAFTAVLGIEGTGQVKKDGILYIDSRTRFLDITDGTSNTLLVGERPPSADGVPGWWYAGEGQSKDGSGDMLLGVQERNVSTCGPSCSVGPYTFGPGQPSNQCDAFHFWRLHTGGANFLFADGAVRFLRYDAVSVLPALATRAGGEVVSPP